MGNGNSSLLLILVLFALLLFASSRSRRRAQRQREETFAQLAPGTEVVTTAGLHATVVEVLEDGTVRLETAPGQISRWDRLAVSRVVSGSSASEPGLEPGVEPATGEPGATTESPRTDGVQGTPPDRV